MPAGKERELAESAMKDYAPRQAAVLLRRLAFQANKTFKLAGPDAVHDLRVSVRRFRQCLRIFGQFFPAKEAKKIQRELREVMDLAGAVRDRDIALELLREAKTAPRGRLAVTLEGERKSAEQELSRALRRWSRKNMSGKWRRALKL